MRKVLVLVGMVLAAGCSSQNDNNGSSGGTGQDGGPGSGDDGGGGGSTCAPQAIGEATLTTPASTVIDVAVDGSGAAWVLYAASDGGLVLAQPGGASHPLESAFTSAALATRPDGTVCAAWGVKPKGAHTACAPDFAVEDTKLDVTIDHSAPLSYREGALGGALFFEGEYAAIDSATRTDGSWVHEELFESSITYPGSTRALSDAADGAPYCYIADQGSGGGGVVVKSWLRSGSANTWGSVQLDGSAGATACSVAKAGNTVGVLVTGNGAAKFAAATSPIDGYAAQLVPEAFDAPSISNASLASTATDFVVTYVGSEGLVRAARPASGGAWKKTTIAIPGGGTPSSAFVNVDHAGAEHLVTLAGGKVYYQRSCPGS